MAIDGVGEEEIRSADDRLPRLHALCLDRWPSIMKHCSDGDLAQRVLFCLSHAGFCSADDISFVTGEGASPSTIAAFDRSLQKDAAFITHSTISSHLTFFSHIAAPDAFCKTLTGSQINLPYDVIVSGRKNDKVTNETIELLSKTMRDLQAKGAAIALVAPDGAQHLQRLLDVVREFNALFDTNLSSLLQTNLPLFRTVLSPMGDQLGNVASDLSERFSGLQRLNESLEQIRRFCREIGEIDTAPDSGCISEEAILGFRQCEAILRTAIENHESI